MIFIVVIVFLLFLAPVLDNWYDEDREQEKNVIMLAEESRKRDRTKRRY